MVRTEKAVFVTGSKLEIFLSNYYTIQTSVVNCLYVTHFSRFKHGKGQSFF
jgi:hypothetical protein